jgi:quercetin dioxygenase-like cupin family protein
VLYCTRGSIRFDLPESGESFDLNAGDRLDIPPGTTHSAIVGPDGVTCLEAARTS